MSVMDQAPGVDSDERSRQTMDALQEAQAEDVAAAPVETVTGPELPAELTSQDEADLEALDASREVPAPEFTTNRVSDAHVLDLREKQRAENEANAMSRVIKIQEMADAGESTVTAGALDRQTERLATPAMDTQVTTDAENAPGAGQKPAKEKGIIGKGLEATAKFLRLK